MWQLILFICIGILVAILLDMYRNHYGIIGKIEKFEEVKTVTDKKLDEVETVVAQLRDAVNTMESRNSEQLATIRESISQLEMAKTAATGMAAEQHQAVSLIKPDTTIAGSNTEQVKPGEFSSPPIEINADTVEKFFDDSNFTRGMEDDKDVSGEYNTYGYNHVDKVIPDNSIAKKRVERFINRSYTVMPTQFYELNGETM